MTFLGMIAGQIGTVFAVRTRRPSLRSVGVAAEILLAALFVYAPPAQTLLGTAPPLVYPVIVWGADEFMRCLVRKRVRREN